MVARTIRRIHAANAGSSAAKSAPAKAVRTNAEPAGAQPATDKTAKAEPATAKPAAAKPATNGPAASANTVPDKPPAPTRVMTVVLPPELTTAVLNTRQLERHLGVSASTNARLWARPGISMLRRSQLIDMRRGTPAHCAGGPVRLLDLGAMRHGAAVAAGIRYQHWMQVVQGTRPATPWSSYLQRHVQDPDDYPRERAGEEFLAQPRVCAMRMHNAAQYSTAAHLDPYELEVYQAGQVAFASYHSMWAICTDAVLAAEGTRLAPASAHLSDWITYLDRATRHIESLDPTRRLLTVTLHR